MGAAKLTKSNAADRSSYLIVTTSGLPFGGLSLDVSVRDDDFHAAEIVGADRLTDDLRYSVRFIAAQFS